MKVALVHDWLTGMRGGEKFLEYLCELFPEADIYTLIHVKGSVSPRIEKHKIITSFLQYFPGVKRYYRYLLPLMPAAIESLKIKGYDLVISSSHCVAKGAHARGALHICYCHTPMRYLWQMRKEYFSARQGKVTAKIFELFAGYLKRWDIKTASNPDYFLANSKNIQARIKECYQRDATVIYSGIDTRQFFVDPGAKNYYLVVSAFAPYKRVDLAIEVFNGLNLPLKVIGTGQDEKKLRNLAGKNIEFLGWQPDDKVRGYYAGCKALIFPGEEDFGLVPLEVMASGRPGIAYAKGGALETVRSGVSGKFFNEQTVTCLREAVLDFEKNIGIFDPQKVRAQALRFDREIFLRELKSFIDDKIKHA